MQAVKISSGVFRHVEAEIRDFHDGKRELEKMKMNIVLASPVPDLNGGGKSNLPSDPTGSKALKLTSAAIVHKEYIIHVIESQYERLGEPQREVIRLWYWKRPRTLTWDGIALEMEKDKTTVMRWRDGFVFAIAEKMGWM